MATIGADEDDATGGSPLPPGTIDLCRLVDTYSYWRRPFTWLAWHVPGVKSGMRLLFRVNPYKRVIAIVDPASVAKRKGVK